jgi:hypothetical protein
MARRKKRSLVTADTSSEQLPERFYNPEIGDGPTGHFIRPYVDDLVDWLESVRGVPSQFSRSQAIRVMEEIDTLPSVWLDHAANAGIGWRHYEPWRPEPVEVPESDAREVVVIPPALPEKPTYEDLMAHIRGQAGQR